MKIDKMAFLDRCYRNSLSAFIFLKLLQGHIFGDLSANRPFQELNMKTEHQPMWTEQLSLLQKLVIKLFEKFKIWQVSGGLFSHLPTHHPASRFGHQSLHSGIKGM